MIVLFTLFLVIAFFVCMVARQYYRLFLIVYASVSRVIVFLDSDFRILSINTKGALVMGEVVRELVGQPFLDLFPASQQEIAKAILDKKKSGNPMVSKAEIDYYNESKTTCWSYFNFLRWRREIVFLSRDPFLKEYEVIRRMQRINQNYQEFVFNSFKKTETLHDFIWNFIYGFQQFFESTRVLIIESTTAQVLYDTDEHGKAFPKKLVDYLISVSSHGIGVIKSGSTTVYVDEYLDMMNVNYQMTRIIKPNWLFVMQKTNECSKNFYMQQWDQFEHHIFFQLMCLFEFELKEYHHDRR